MGRLFSTHGRQLQAKFWSEKLKVSFDRLKSIDMFLKFETYAIELVTCLQI
jgi:hypothetical protein